MPRVLITGGAGFVGANLAIALAARHADWSVIALDNLYRRGSELNLPRLRAAGVEFVHGDVRTSGDIEAVQAIDALVECSAEPSALAGSDGQTAYPFAANLIGAYHCLELARRDGAQVVFLSTSRVYPFGALERLRLDEHETRLAIAADQDVPGAGPDGIGEDFPLEGPRTLYGATKLSAELLIAEYAASFGIPTVIDRCGVIAGPWQMGKVDQGVFTYWMLAHHFGRPLRYIGFGGTGKQVRDLLHVDDLVDLVDDQIQRPDHWRGATVNIGGGPDVSLSLLETTQLCQELTGREIAVEPTDEERPGDVPVYISDCRRLTDLSDWRPQRDARAILVDILAWVQENEDAVKSAAV